MLLAAWAHRRKKRSRVREIGLERTKAVELAFLTAATLYSLSLPFKHSLTLIDTVVLFGIFASYLWRVSLTPLREPDLLGPARIIGNLSPVWRRFAFAGLFALAGYVLLASAHPFADALVETGRLLGISEFLLIQWVGPLASESPELLPVCIFAWRMRTTEALGSLLSSKVNQWTLLVGALPAVFTLSSGSLSGLPLTPDQREEILLTAAQSAFAVAILANLRLTAGMAVALLGLFFVQFTLSVVLPEARMTRTVERVGLSGIYLVLAARIGIARWHAFQDMVRDGVLAHPSDLEKSG